MGRLFLSSICTIIVTDLDMKRGPKQTDAKQRIFVARSRTLLLIRKNTPANLLEDLDDRVQR